MNLQFGPFKLDTKGMPAVVGVRVFPPAGPDRPVMVILPLASSKRSAVEKWATQLGAEVTETISPLYEGDTMPLDIRAAAERGGFLVEVYTRAAAPAEAREQDPAPLHWPSRGLSTTTSCGGEPLTAESFAPRETDVTCPGCRALLPAETPNTSGSAS